MPERFIADGKSSCRLPACPLPSCNTETQFDNTPNTKPGPTDETIPGPNLSLGNVSHLVVKVFYCVISPKVIPCSTPTCPKAARPRTFERSPPGRAIASQSCPLQSSMAQFATTSQQRQRATELGPWTYGNGGGGRGGLFLGLGAPC